MSLHRERGQMAIDDVRALPTTPLVVAEGSVVPASLVSSGLADESRAIWLLPTHAFQRTQLAELPPGPRTLYSSLRDLIDQETREHGAPVLTVDGTRGIDEMTDAVEGLFGAVVSEGPTAETRSERRALLRGANEAVVNQVRGFYSRPWADGNPESVIRSFICECGDTGCIESVDVTVRSARKPVYAPGHS
jgi:hypothetical protein